MIIFDRNNPQFRKMNYAMMAKMNTEGNKVPREHQIQKRNNNSNKYFFKQKK